MHLFSLGVTALHTFFYLCADHGNLDVLALTAENVALEQRNKDLEAYCAKLVLEKEDLQHDTKEKEKKALAAWTLELLIERNRVKYYTGFEANEFMMILHCLGADENIPFNQTGLTKQCKTLTTKQQLLLVLMKLRKNFDFKHLSTLFCISEKNVGTLFKHWINFLFFKFAQIQLWPDRDVFIKMVPENFKKNFPNTFLILDGTEVKCQKPSSLRSQSQCYSDYKSSTTLKALVGVDPRGSFTFISHLFSGSISDKDICHKSGLFKFLELLIQSGKLLPGDAVMVDKGFLIESELTSLGLRLWRPPFASSDSQMPAADVAKTKLVAKYRVRVENAIGRAKKFRIISDKIDMNMWPYANQIWFACCFLTNFMSYLVKDD